VKCRASHRASHWRHERAKIWTWMAGTLARSRASSTPMPGHDVESMCFEAVFTTIVSPFVSSISSELLRAINLASTGLELRTPA